MSTNPILDAALQYDTEGWDIIATDAGSKGGGLPTGWLDRARYTPDELRALFATGDKSIAVRTGARSAWLVDVDLDDAVAVQLAPHLLPPGAAIFGRTGRARSHYLYQLRADEALPRNKVTHGGWIEVRGDKHKTTLPPSVHPDGSRYEWDERRDPEVVSVEELLGAVRRLAVAVGLVKVWPAEGQRNTFAQALAGTMARAELPLAHAEQIVALVTRTVGDPDNRVGEAIRPTYEKFARGATTISGIPTLVKLVDQAQKPALDAVLDALKVGRTEVVPPEAPGEAEPLRVPDACMVGLARHYADLMAAHMEAPRSFHYFSYLAYLGALLAGKVTLRSSLPIEARLYVVLVAASGTTRKSTAARAADRFFAGCYPDGTLPLAIFHGLGSGEGLAKELRKQSTALLHYDELKSFVDKSKAEGSILLPMVTTLFERGEFDNVTKGDRVSVRGARLSMLAACTTETYRSMFDQRYTGIGFINRLFIVTDEAERRYAIPTALPAAESDRVQAATRALLDRVDEAYTRNQCRPIELPVEPAALRAFEGWYHDPAVGRSIHSTRLDTYGHRLMVLLALTTGRWAVTEDVAEAVVGLLRYELEARRETDPGDADTAIARLEQRIVAALARGGRHKRDLQKAVSVSKVGLWAWTTAVKNLKGDGRLASKLMPRAAGTGGEPQEYFWVIEEPGAGRTAGTSAGRTPEGSEVRVKAGGTGLVAALPTHPNEGGVCVPPLVGLDLRSIPSSDQAKAEIVGVSGRGSGSAPRAPATRPCSFCQGTDFYLDKDGVRACRKCFPAAVASA